MRLLHIDSFTFEEIHESSNNPPPPYAIASHRWIAGTEASLADVSNKENTSKPGYCKVEGFVAFIKANAPQIKYLWIDTCCIDQKSSLEVSTAIRSMFRWYRQAEVCLAYLDDVSKQDDLAAFDRSVWFQRGWTLQELLAPAVVMFLTQDWEIIGHKGRSGYGRKGMSLRTGRRLDSRISTITSIPEPILRDYEAAHDVSVEVKLSWIKDRQTLLDEDRWYCMLGILGVDLDIRYGLGGQVTYERLLRKLAKQGQSPRLNSTSSYATANWSQRQSSMDAGMSLHDSPRPSLTSTNGPIRHSPEVFDQNDDEMDGPTSPTLDRENSIEHEFRRIRNAEPTHLNTYDGITCVINLLQKLHTRGPRIDIYDNLRFQNIRAQNTILQNSRAILHNVNHRDGGLSVPVSESVEDDAEAILREVYQYVRNLLDNLSPVGLEKNCPAPEAGPSRTQEHRDSVTEQSLAPKEQLPPSGKADPRNRRYWDALDELNFHLHSLETFWDDEVITARTKEMRQMIRMLELHPDPDLDRSWKSIELATGFVRSSLPPTYSLLQGDLNEARTKLKRSDRVRPNFYGLYLEYREPFPNLYRLDETHYRERPVTAIFLSINHVECKQTIKEWLYEEDIKYEKQESGTSFVVKNALAVDKLRKALCGIRVTIKVICEEKELKKLTKTCDGKSAFWVLCFKTTGEHAFERACQEVSCIWCFEHLQHSLIQLCSGKRRRRNTVGPPLQTFFSDSRRTRAPRDPPLKSKPTHLYRNPV